MKQPLFSRLSAAAALVLRGNLPAAWFDRVWSLGDGANGVSLGQPFAESVWVMRAIKKISGPIAAVPLKSVCSTVNLCVKPEWAACSSIKVCRNIFLFGSVFASVSFGWAQESISIFIIAMGLSTWCSAIASHIARGPPPLFSSSFNRGNRV